MYVTWYFQVFILQISKRWSKNGPNSPAWCYGPLVDLCEPYGTLVTLSRRSSCNRSARAACDVGCVEIKQYHPLSVVKSLKGSCICMCDCGTWSSRLWFLWLRQKCVIDFTWLNNFYTAWKAYRGRVKFVLQSKWSLPKKNFKSTAYMTAGQTSSTWLSKIPSDSYINKPPEKDRWRLPLACIQVHP